MQSIVDGLSAVPAGVWGFLGAVGGAAVSVVPIYFKLRVDVERMITQQALRFDVDLRKRRIKAYTELWRRLEVLPEYGGTKPTTYQGLVELAVSLRTFYFEHGGIFMTDQARDAYFGVQQGIVNLVNAAEHARPPLGPEDKLRPPSYDYIRKRGSDLRTALRIEIGTRVLNGETPPPLHLEDRHADPPHPYATDPPESEHRFAETTHAPTRIE